MFNLTRGKTGQQVSGKEQGIAPIEDAKKKQNLGKHMRTFRWTRTKERMTTYKDVDYMNMLFTTVVSANCAYFADACVEAYERGQKVGNMKDEDADQKAGFENSCDYALEVLLELSAQWPITNLLANFPKSDNATAFGTGATGQVTIANYEDATMSKLLQRMDGLMIPEVVVKVHQVLNFYFKYSSEWMDKKNNVIPSRYFLIRYPYKSAADIETLVNALWSEQGELKMHAQRFGIKLTKFSPDMLKPRQLGINDKDAIAYFQHACINMRDGLGTGNTTLKPLYPFDADGAEGKRWFFYDDPNESPINYLAKLFQPYNATYNKYGGALAGGSNATGADSAAVQCKYSEGTEMLAVDVEGIIEFLYNYSAVWEGAGVVNFELTGTGVTNKDIDLASMGLTSIKYLDLGLFYGTGVDETELDETLISYLIELMF